jgi:acyl-CoA dehydrogenase
VKGAGTVGRTTARDLAHEAVPLLARHAAEVDEAASFPVESVRGLRDSGLFGLLVPVEHGGLGGDLDDLVAVAQILASGCLSTAMIWAMHCQQVDSVVRFGSPRLCAELLPRIANGGVYIASVTTEAGTGGHLLTAGAALHSSGETIVVERDAPIVTGGAHADGFLITMRDTADASDNKVTLVYADRSQLRLDESSGWNALGMRGTQSIGMRLAGEVPGHHVVGARGEYRTVAVESMIPAAHLGWAACWLGTARAGYADVVSLIRSPRRPKSLDPGSPLVASRLARARADLELIHAYLTRVTDEVLEHRAADRTLDTPETQIHLNTLKVTAAELTFRVVDTLIQLTGLATGYLRNSAVPLERHFRDLRSASLNFSNDRLLTTNGALALLDRSVRLA